ncbi:alpha/beta hydrolase family protein [Bradyrhizobium sp. 2TAF24]|uniref:alpha/beta hydrolase family protein n=1 Tax=Bradyrhizobium sp. 2TAF24 TaxID=3233011 RepID=UPI003F8E7F94
MRFPGPPGCIASITVSLTSLNDTMAFWRGVLRPLGFGRIGEWSGCVLWAGEQAQLLLQEADEPSKRLIIMLRAKTRQVVDAIHATAVREGWPVVETPAPKFIAPGYYSCVLAVPGEPSIRITIACAWDGLPERADAALVRIPGADPDVVLGGYLFRPEMQRGGAVIVLHGYASNAAETAGTGRLLAAAGWTALCLSQRGWIGSTGREDQGLRQPDDVLCAAEWLQRETGNARVGVLGFSQGGQVALLAAARDRPFAFIVAYFPCTDLRTWPQQAKANGIEYYLEDFVAPEDIARCSPVSSAARIGAPTLLIHGEEDCIVPIKQSEAMVAANPAIQLFRVPGGEHGLREHHGVVWPTVLAFIDRELEATR